MSDDSTTALRMAVAKIAEARGLIEHQLTELESAPGPMSQDRHRRLRGVDDYLECASSLACALIAEDAGRAGGEGAA